jgi:hypothetical protein
MCPKSNDVLGEAQQLIDAHPYPFYVILLGLDSDTALKDYVVQNWTNLHYMSGNECLLLSAYKPQAGDEEVKRYWKDKLGNSFERFYNNSPLAAWSYSYAQQLGVHMDKLPALFIGTDLAEDRGLVVQIPPWNATDLRRLFERIFQKTHEASKLDSEQRLKAIEDSIGHLYKAKMGLFYTKNHWMEYVNTESLTKVGVIVAEILKYLH